MGRIKASLVAFICLVTLSCGTYIKVNRISPQALAPTTSCEVYTSKVPDRPYEEIALLEVAEGGDRIQAARKKAMQLGADAIILQGERTAGGIFIPVGTSVVYGTSNRMTFLAVKWKD